MKRSITFFGRRPPEIVKSEHPGRLFVLEGSDGSGRSTQITQLAEWLEGNGYAVKIIGIKRSSLVSEELEQAQQGNTLTRTTLSLFYATDFFDQLLNEIVPALRAGLIVLADRYVYTLMIRDLVRGADPEWVRNLYSPAILPDAVFYLRASVRNLIDRTFQKNAALDYWESGMDLGLSRDMFNSFLKYQKMVQAEFDKMQQVYGFHILNANCSAQTVQLELRKHLQRQLEI